MLRILHISDPHAEPETMRRLQNLAISQRDCDVVALTGDCLAKTRAELSDPLPEEWDRWPQGLKLSVPGNHDDRSRTYVHLHSWLHQTPWVYRLDDLLFVGLDLLSRGGGEQQLATLQEQDYSGTTGVVLLSHEPPPSEPGNPLIRALVKFVDGRRLLVLHGHAHREPFPGSEWDDSAGLAGTPCYRSNVRSSQQSREGLGHRVEWRAGDFFCTVVRGDFEHPAAPLPA